MSDELFSALFAKRPQVIKPGLERMQRALSALHADTWPKVPTVLVAGTNGKGTTSAYLWQLLGAVGLRAGLFTSPHLVHFAERIQVHGAQVDDQVLVAAWRRLEAELPAAIYAELSFFEINTLLAMQLFRQQQTAVDILEVGLGGRWDSTNVASPCLSIITSIGLDHQQWLGTTTAAIAGEKAGIMRPGVPVIWGGPQAADAAAAAVLAASAAALAAPSGRRARSLPTVATAPLGSTCP